MVRAGVYAVGHIERTPLARAHAAVLACGEGAALSHDSAAALWALPRRRWPREPEVIARWDRHRAGVRNHRSRTLRAGDVTVNHGMPVTAVARTILDILPRINRRHGEREVDASFERERVIVELDSWEYHGDRHSFAVDRERDTANIADGYVTVRLTPERLTAAEARRLERILAARSARR